MINILTMMKKMNIQKVMKITKELLDSCEKLKKEHFVLNGGKILVGLLCGIQIIEFQKNVNK